jgi:hypothetical protein
MRQPVRTFSRAVVRSARKLRAYWLAAAVERQLGLGLVSLVAHHTIRIEIMAWPDKSCTTDSDSPMLGQIETRLTYSVLSCICICALHAARCLQQGVLIDLFHVGRTGAS